MNDGELMQLLLDHGFEVERHVENGTPWNYSAKGSFITFKRLFAALERKVHPSYVTTTSGMRGQFAVLMQWNPDLGGFYQPYFTGETCKTHADAVKYAKDWADAEGIEYRP